MQVISSLLCRINRRLRMMCLITHHISRGGHLGNEWFLLICVDAYYEWYSEILRFPFVVHLWLDLDYLVNLVMHLDYLVHLVMHLLHLWLICDICLICV
jgi:hypothetical protein